MFPNLDFSQIQIKLNALTTLAAEPIPDNTEIDDKVLVTDGPGGVANNPKKPDGQTTIPPANP